MMNYTPIRTVKQLLALNCDEITEGYFEARKGYVLTGNESESFVHGWRNGLTDSYAVTPDEAQMALARDILRAKREGKIDF